MPVIPGPSRKLREVDIMNDASVWAILDEGCNTTCHSRMWRENAEEKFLNQGFVVERFDSKKEYHGVGDKPVMTKHCYSFPFNISLGPYQRSLAGVLQSQELGHEGFVPRLLSLPNQCTMGLVKDMRNGTCVLKDYGVSIELCVAKQNGLLCIDIGNMANVLQRRTKLPTHLRYLRWGSEEWLEYFMKPGKHCNGMPDLPDEATQKDRGSWADWTEQEDKMSDTSSIHSEPGLTNNKQPNTDVHECSTCDKTHAPHAQTLTAAVSDQVERKETEELTCLMAEGKTEGKAKKKLIILSIGIPNQEETAKWAVRNPKGGLTVEQKYAFHNQSDNFLTEEEHSLGSTIGWTVNWHHNAHQRKLWMEYGLTVTRPSLLSMPDLDQKKKDGT